MTRLQRQYLLDRDLTQVFHETGSADFCGHDLCVSTRGTDRPAVHTAKIKANITDNDESNDYV